MGRALQALETAATNSEWDELGVQLGKGLLMRACGQHKEDKEVGRPEEQDTVACRQGISERI